jgi:epoxyqueuosine reductase
VCQEVCPYNKRKATVSRWPEFSKDSGVGPYLKIEEVLGIRTEEEFEEQFGGTPLTRPGRAGLVRNCCVAAGNLGRREAVPALVGCLCEDGSSLVRGHAAWALGEIGGEEAGAALERAFLEETDEECREEIEYALGASFGAEREGLRRPFDGLE